MKQLCEMDSRSFTTASESDAPILVSGYLAKKTSKCSSCPQVSSELGLASIGAYQKFPVVNGVGVPQNINESRDIPGIPLDGRAGVSKLIAHEMMTYGDKHAVHLFAEGKDEPLVVGGCVFRGLTQVPLLEG